jgi:hypothetical protein
MGVFPWRMFVFGRVPRLHAADGRKATGSRRRAEEGVLELCRGMELGTRRARPGAFPVRSAGLAESERDQARAKQHEACCGHCEESFGYEIIVTHVAPADRDAGPNLLKLSESFPLQHRPRTIAFISVRNENAGADEAE